MTQYNWIKPEELSIKALLVLDQWAVNMLVDYYKDQDFQELLGVVLKHHPDILWVWSQKCPDKVQYLEDLAAKHGNAMAIRPAEIQLIEMIETTIIYAYPELMATCDYIVDWEEKYLLEMVDFQGKTVLDVGSGTGRLAFAAAKKADLVVASEPMTPLRDYMRRIVEDRGLDNVRVTDGFAAALPFPDKSFDIVMSGHVVGDDLETELKEYTRVLKDGGWIIDCIGEDNRKRTVNHNLVEYGFEALYHKSKTGGDIYRYRLQIKK